MIHRREILQGFFCSGAMLAAGGLPGVLQGPSSLCSPSPAQGPKIKAGEVLEHFLSRSSWVNREKTSDHVLAGDPEQLVDRCLVTWMPTFRALDQMVTRGIQMMICHEPAHWTNKDPRPDVDRVLQEKRQLIADKKLVVIRNHDCWDKWPDIGIPWAWAQFLGFGNKPKEIGANGYQHRYDAEQISVDDLARKIANRCASIGEAAVQVIGDGKKTVSRIGIGTGCGCSITAYQEMGCDCSIVCDDGSCYWSSIQQAEDLGHPVIRVNHGTSEEPGMVTMTRYINENITGLRAEHFPHGSTFRLVGSDRNQT